MSVNSSTVTVDLHLKVRSSGVRLKVSLLQKKVAEKMLSSYHDKEHTCNAFFNSCSIKVYKNSKYTVPLKVSHYTLHTFAIKPVHTDEKCIKMHLKSYFLIKMLTLT